MSNRDFYFVIVLVVTLVSGIAASCQRSTLCPCGAEGKVLNYTQCLDDTSDERSACERWANCKTCESNTTYCLTCPTGRSGPACAEDMPRLYCKLPEINATGMIMEPILDINDKGKMFPPGTEMKFDCEDGYELEGNTWIIYCQLNGEWTSQPPKCIYDYTSEAPAIYCDHPGVDVNGIIEDNNGVTIVGQRQVYLPGAELKYRCVDGYEVVGSNDLVCTLEGEWSSNPPRCRIRTTTAMCKDPLPIQNGGVIVYYSRRTNFRTRDSDINNAREYPVRTRLSYDCKSGYRLEGEKNLVCRPTGLWSAEKPMCAEDCGFSTLQAGGKITFSNSMKAREFPWIVFLFMNQTSGTCAGVLLDHRTVLTAAHCLEDASYCTLYFGKYNRSDEYDDIEVKTRMSSEIIIHPEFNTETFDNDIAIVKFSPDVPYSPRIQPICMPSPDSTAINVSPGKMGHVAGWGFNEYRLPSSRLTLANLPVQASETCMAAYLRRNIQLKITQGMFCAGFRDKNNNCVGQAGSPMLFYNNQMDRFVVEGLASHGTSGRCDRPERYTMFTRVSHYLRWIYENRRRGNN
ncbi:Limulus clotting factor C [Araneus ventricosus]|uniref:Limulus clotting factor C n=1 Tax=Araneus ventricosus TaxID=182803 RepID=A0A4Y2BRH1_ARAVE|nr:Limulus clotting factor C [Araneus ventricosus]